MNAPFLATPETAVPFPPAGRAARHAEIAYPAQRPYRQAFRHGGNRSNPAQTTATMKRPSHVIEIFLQPGDFYFGDRDTRIRTCWARAFPLPCGIPSG